ncbi:DUF5123 domain-containing protein [Algibacter amylolyticus]|uniref:DUF5123 domain-containing protein n=1 Tax=Algibacter amylolyticus TaxID=1608400 RepID=A0A5M7BGF7_9FLAO|nr:DUF5123 domain-containing protein [Algibacter amylolyticus]KAA5827983.1 DUF5123 domain-containing protein [Algibacter amylolyticus]MBB5267223.1 hypothetical protein [Algibacter amylolyticus]TSJ82228.1 DUF5123 domain-containing protein [Algibacter amylolyticus]
MKNKSNIFNIKTVLFLCLIITVFNACSKDDNETFEKTRLFSPVLNAGLLAEGNSIIVNMGKLKGAVGYTIEVSRDTFQTIEYTVPADTNYVKLNENNLGEELFWNSLYQVRATAHDADPQYDSKVSDLGGVRTERFPSILNVPKTFDVTDIAARVSWTPLGDAITGMKAFAPDDLRLETPLFPETPVTEEEFLAGEAIFNGLSPETEYQIAIYSGTELRGWVNYTTKIADIDPTSPGVIDIRDNENPDAVSDAVAAAPNGAIVLVKRGVTYNFPSDRLDKSITIRAAYGFGEQKAKIVTSGSWDIEAGSTIDHIRFIDMEVRGEDFGGDYVFNTNRSDVYVGEILFDNCTMGTFRGLVRIRGTVEVDNYKIMNTVVDSIGGYGLFTTDTNPSDPPTARVNNIVFSGSTFNKIDTGIQSRNNSQSIIIEDCTFANFIKNGARMFRYRGGDGNDNVINGIKITNSIFGHSWDQAESGTYGMQGIAQGLANTNFELLNNYSTTNFSFSEGTEIPGFPIGNYTSTQEDLWVDTDNNDFNFKDIGFFGKFSAGAPMWRTKL